MVMTYSFADYIRLTAITYQSFGLDKKRQVSVETCLFLAVRLTFKPQFNKSEVYNDYHYLLFFSIVMLDTIAYMRVTITTAATI